MTGTYTSRGNLYKTAADGNDFVSVVQDISNNMDKLDALLGWCPVTAASLPASAFQGAPFYTTDTVKLYVNGGAGGSAATSYKQVLLAGSTFDSNISLGSSALQFTAGSSGASATFSGMRGTSTHLLVSGRTLSASANDMFSVTVAGLLSWGAGSTAPDVNLYRSAADTLKTDDSFSVGASLTVAASANLADTIITGNRVTNGATERPQLHTSTTVQNTTGETAIQTVTIPASDAAVGSTYRIRIGGTAAVAAATTPTLTFRARLGGASGTLIASLGSVTCRSGMSDGYWDAELMLTCSSTGASGTWTGFLKGGHNFVGGVSTYATLGPVATASITKDTTAAQDLVITAQWSAASSSNTATARTGQSGRVA